MTNKMEHSGICLFLKSHINQKFMQQIDVDTVQRICFGYNYQDWADGKKYPNENDLKILNDFFKTHKNVEFAGISEDESWQIPLLSEVEKFSINRLSLAMIDLLKNNRITKLDLRFPPEKQKYDLINLLIFKDTLEEWSLNENYKNLEMALNGFKKLKKLSLSSIKIDFNLLEESTVEDFYYYGSKTKEWDGIVKFNKLKHLMIKNNITLENIDFLQTMTDLETIDFWYCSKINHFPDLSHLCNLKKITAYDCKRLDDYENLGKLKRDIEIKGFGNLPETTSQR
jgi:hypothetical protein